VTQNPTHTAKMSKKQRNSWSSTRGGSKRKKTSTYNESETVQTDALEPDGQRKQHSKPDEIPHETTV